MYVRIIVSTIRAIGGAKGRYSIASETQLFFASAALPYECCNRTYHAQRSQSRKRVDFRHIGRTSVSAYSYSHQYSEREPNPHVSPLTLIVYLRRLRSHRSAAIEPTTPIAASPEKASISGTAHQDSVGAYRCSHKHSKADPNSHVSPLMRLPNA